MRSVRVLMMIAVLLFAVKIGGEIRVRAQAGCSLQSVNGAYAYAVRGGYVGDQFGDIFDFSEVGRFVADGNGSISATATISDNETISRGVKFTGTYIANDDCTGTMTFRDANNRVFANMDIVVANNGKDLNLIEADRGTNIAGEARQQFPAQ